MVCREIIDILERACPKEYALEWDNVGLLAGRDDKEVIRIYIALDATDEIIDAAVSEKADMLITHHPLIFNGLKKIHNRDFIGNRLLKLIQNDISYYAMHTNYDVCRMGRLSGERMGFVQSEVLEVTCEKEIPMGIGEIAVLAQETTLGECAGAVKEAFKLGNVKIYGNLEKKIRKAAICPGAGKSVIKEALRKDADVLITGDIGHHEGIDATAQGLAVIDAGHYGVEHIFIDDVKTYLSGRLNGVQTIAAPIVQPFQII
ncbi:MAG: Nif3-like dinuclear metal center hexameric protein [Dorea sp.]|nr:Nif3-like dinuclear metal center hexameric protein [Dorea sp.]